MEIRSGDSTTFRQVYNEIFPVLMRVAYHVVYNVDVAEDICQETFIRFYDKDMTFPSLDDAKFWLIRVTKNLAINHVKKNVKEVSFLDNVKKTTSITHYRDGASELILNESQEAVRKAISSLPEIYRTVVVLREFGDLDYKSIAKILDISESNVKVRIHRARKELEVMLNQEEIDVP